MPNNEPLVRRRNFPSKSTICTASGIYANLAIVSHSETEFVVDFIFHSPQPPKAKVRARILTNPIHMKRLLAALQDNVRKYEERFGVIRTGDVP